MDLHELHAAEGRWHEACRQWLEERGLVTWPMRGITWLEYQRTAREEPHRVLHRPPPPEDTDV